MTHFEIAEYHVTNYPNHLTLLLLNKPYHPRGVGWVPAGTEDGLHARQGKEMDSFPETSEEPDPSTGTASRPDVLQPIGHGAGAVGGVTGPPDPD